MFIYTQYIENSSSAKSLFLHLGSSTHCKITIIYMYIYALVNCILLISNIKFLLAHLWMPIDLQTEILPYMAIINIPLRNWGMYT